VTFKDQHSVFNALLVSQIAFKQSGITRMTTTKQYDMLNRLLSVCSAPSAAFTTMQTSEFNAGSPTAASGFVSMTPLAK